MNQYSENDRLMLERLNHPDTLIIIGRGHSGTRILPKALEGSGIFFGSPLNSAYDLLPAEPIYEACRIFGPYVTYKGNYEWDFARVNQMEIPQGFTELLQQYLHSLLHSEKTRLGWKIPQNTLIFPWLVRLLPAAKFIHWIRHPEGSCSKMTGIDRLEKWGIDCDRFLFHEWNYKIRLASWKYHYDIVHQTPKPDHFMEIRFEDYITEQARYKKQVEDFIGIPLKELELDKNKIIGATKNLGKKYPFVQQSMMALDYS